MPQLVKVTLYLETRTDPEVSEKKKPQKTENYSSISLFGFSRMLRKLNG